VRDHTSLKAWREAHAVSVGVIRLSRNAWKPYAAALFSQLQRASLSVELNIAEGYTFGNTRNFTRHLGIAYGSAVETVELLRIGTEADVLPADSAALLDRADLARRLLLGLLKRRRRFPST
jgi:four helix bundle protein